MSKQLQKGLVLDEKQARKWNHLQGLIIGRGRFPIRWKRVFLKEEVDVNDKKKRETQRTDPDGRDGREGSRKETANLLSNNQRT
jgi:hypothetical protein